MSTGSGFPFKRKIETVSKRWLRKFDPNVTFRENISITVNISTTPRVYKILPVYSIPLTGLQGRWYHGLRFHRCAAKPDVSLEVSGQINS